MAHRRTTSRFTLEPPSQMSTTPIISPPSVSTLLGTFSPRKPRYRATVIALLALIALSSYVFFVSTPSLTLTPIGLRSSAHSKQDSTEESRNPASRLFHYTKKPIATTAGAVRPQVELTQAQELAAISSFLASLPQNVIPPSVDPSQPIDPQLVLDFDTRSPRAAQEVKAIVEDVWTRNPVILFSKYYSPLSREVKAILGPMNLRPEPTIFEVDQRDDADVLAPLLYRLTDSEDLPILLVGGKPIGSVAQIRALEASGQLKELVTEAGAIVGGGKKKKGRK